MQKTSRLWRWNQRMLDINSWGTSSHFCHSSQQRLLRSRVRSGTDWDSVSHSWTLADGQILAAPRVKPVYQQRLMHKLYILFLLPITASSTWPTLSSAASNSETKLLNIISGNFLSGTAVSPKRLKARLNGHIWNIWLDPKNNTAPAKSESYEATPHHHPT